MPTRFFFNGNPDFGSKTIGTKLKGTRKKHAEKARQLLLQPTLTWNHSVSFTIDEKGDTVAITTDDEPYGYLDEGTKPHLITGNPVLRFQENFKPKTTPNSLNSVAGGKSGNYVHPPPTSVQHPGNEARNFSQQVIDKIEPAFQADVDNDIAKSLT